VILNIYDLQSQDGKIDVSKWNNILVSFGLGAFHTGVEVFNWEISFSCNGSYTLKLKSHLWRNLLDCTQNRNGHNLPQIYHHGRSNTHFA
jgi:hypothetical protein